MNLTKSKFRNRLPWAVFLVIVVTVVSELVFTRYVFYHSQNRSLRPNDYNIQVVTAEDYRSLSDPSKTTIQLADGSVLTKGVAWDSGRFKPIEDGAKYVKVTTKGTAHLLYYTLQHLLPCLFLALVGLLVTWPRTDKNGQASRTTESNATSG